MPLNSTRSNWTHDKTEATATGGMVSSRHPLSAEAGLEILKAGGNAVDAAVAASFAESVVQPAASTIGGGGLFTISLASGETHGINYMWQAPLKASGNMFPMEGVPERGLFGWSGVKDQANEIGGLAVAVPGSVAGLVKASKQFGRLPLADVMRPAIRLAKEGFEMDWYGSLMAGIHLDILKRFPTTAKALLRDGEFPFRPNMIGRADIHRQSSLAETLSAIAKDGAAAFYTGQIAKSIVDAVNAHGGVFSEEDLSTYEAIQTKTIQVEYHGHVVRGQPAGFTIYGQCLNVLAHMDLGAYAPNSAKRLHLLIEVFRHCLRDRMKVNPDMGTREGAWSYLLSAEYAKRLAQQINRERRSDIVSWISDYQENQPAGDSRTVHIAAVDGEGSMASLTETVIGNYGSFVMSDSGVLLNNGMISFAPVPGYSNSIEPGRRPSSFISPLHITRPDGSIFTVGSSGGIKIMTSVLQLTSFMIDHGMSPQQAASQPRIDFEGPKVIVDGRFDQATLDELKDLGHDIEVRSEELSTFEYGNPCILSRDLNGVIQGGVNPYQATVAAGYDR